jgi:hypothetical protein
MVIQPGLGYGSAKCEQLEEDSVAAIEPAPPADVIEALVGLNVVLHTLDDPAA